MIEIAWGIRVEDRHLVGVDQVESGLACGCICPECHKPLVAAKGDIVQHHFRHHADPLSPCGGGQETALHQMAKAMVVEAKEIMLPDGLRSIVSAELEPWLDGVRPDVRVRTPSGNVAIEIAVNHRTAQDKVIRFHDLGLNAVEIDLSYYRGVVMNSEELRQAVLITAKRYWLRVKDKAGKPVRPRPQPPSLQELVERFTVRDAAGTIIEGGYPRITEEAWSEFHSAMTAWKIDLKEGAFYQGNFRTARGTTP
jgi:hypothetical protein